jgi:1-deoxy-D-xylulose-5-phosphate reductoisomerase
MIVPVDNFLRRQERKKPIAICILGSTGSIGSSALELVRSNPDQFEVVGLAAGRNAVKLAEQIREFKPRTAAIHDEKAGEELIRILAAGNESQTEVNIGSEAVCKLASHPDVELVLAAIMGFAGLRSVLAAIKSGKRIALANKESLVSAGELVKKELLRSEAAIIPVDSEHSALFQALQGHCVEDIERLVLTASGGPFLDLPKEEFDRVTPVQALRHPRWDMGPKITVDSATLVNKALEVIEAYWLFGVKTEQIDVVVHPQSIVHSLVSFTDGTNIAQLSVPDMKGPIAYAMTYPDGRLKSAMQFLDLPKIGKLDFKLLNREKFPAVDIAFRALEGGGALPAVFNIANEIAVDAFLNERYPFGRIVPFVDRAVREFNGCEYETVEDLIALENEVRLKMELAA